MAKGNQHVKFERNPWITEIIGSFSLHKIAKWIVGFIQELKGLIGNSRLFKRAMQMRVDLQLVTVFLGVPALSKVRIHGQV